MTSAEGGVVTLNFYNTDRLRDWQGDRNEGSKLSKLCGAINALRMLFVSLSASTINDEHSVLCTYTVTLTLEFGDRASDIGCIGVDGG